MGKPITPVTEITPNRNENRLSSNHYQVCDPRFVRVLRGDIFKVSITGRRRFVSYSSIDVHSVSKVTGCSARGVKGVRRHKDGYVKRNSDWLIDL